MLYKVAAYIIATLHLTIMALNLLSIPFMIVAAPFYIWMPIITLMVSPLLGGTYCVFNRLENFYRIKADLPLIQDRLWSTLDFLHMKIVKFCHIKHID